MVSAIADWGADRTQGGPAYVVSREERFAVRSRKAYVDGTKRWIEALRDDGIDLAFTTFGDTEGNVEYNAPAQGLDDVGHTLRGWAMAEVPLGETDWGRRRQATVQWVRYSLWWQSAALTYQSPVTSRYSLPYFVWKNLRLHCEAEPEFLRTAARIRDTLDDEPVDRGLGVFRNVSGAEGPLYTVIIPGLDPRELEDWQHRFWAERRPKLKPLLDDLLMTVREITEGRGWHWPDMSLPAR
jgi:hypothetical protein